MVMYNPTRAGAERQAAAAHANGFRGDATVNKKIADCSLMLENVVGKLTRNDAKWEEGKHPRGEGGQFGSGGGSGKKFASRPKDEAEFSELADNAKPKNEKDYSSERQIKAEDHFFAEVKNVVSPETFEDIERYAHKADSNERIDYAMKKLREEFGKLVEKEKSSEKKSFSERHEEATAESIAENKKSSAASAEGLFTPAHLDTLREEYSKIKGMDPTGEDGGYKRLTGMLDKMTQPQLKQLEEAKIPWISGLARNRVRKEAPKAEEKKASRADKQKLDYIKSQHNLLKDPTGHLPSMYLSAQRKLDTIKDKGTWDEAKKLVDELHAKWKEKYPNA